METLKIDQLPKLPPQQQSQQQAQSQPQVTQQPANNEFVEEAEFFAEFEIDKESTTKIMAEPGAGEETLVENEQQIFAPVSSPDPEPQKMDETEARKQTVTLMTMRQTLQSYGIAWYADGSFKTEMANQYNYAPADFNKLVDAWAPVVQTANIRVPPFANILLTEAICTGPLIGLMAQNRKMRKELEYYKNKERKEKAETVRNFNKRPDTKTAWGLGFNEAGVYGYFTHQANGTYIPKQHRKQRPELTPETIELIKKHNGDDAITRLEGK